MYWTMYTIVFIALMVLNTYSLFNKTLAKYFSSISFEHSWMEEFYNYIATGKMKNYNVISTVAMGMFSYAVFTIIALILSLVWPIVIIFAIVCYIVIRKEKIRIEKREDTYSKTKSTEEENFFIN